MIRLHKCPPGFQIVDDEPETGGFSIPGWRFGRLVSMAAVLSETRYHKTPRFVLFQCDCGRKIKLGVVGIRRQGVPDTCGPKCRLGPLRKVQPKSKHPTQASHSREFWTWDNAKKTGMCKRWHKSFKAFFYDLGPKPPGLALCRKDANRLHSPENSYWDHHNSHTSKLTWHGFKVTPQWVADRFGIDYDYLRFEGWRKEGPVTVESLIRKLNRYKLERLNKIK